MLRAKDVAIFHSKFRSILKNTPEEDTIPYYHEMASSEFSVETEDPELQQAFEKIKETIRCNQ